MIYIWKMDDNVCSAESHDVTKFCAVRFAVVFPFRLHATQTPAHLTQKDAVLMHSTGPTNGQNG